MSGGGEMLAGTRKGVVLATMFMLFSMIQFLLNFAGAMGVVIQNQFGVSNALAQLGPAALFLAFLFMGIPGGVVLKRRGYRFTAMLATGFAFAAMGVQLVSGFAASFAVYVVGTFLSGFAACLLNIVVNPMLNSIGGGGNKGNQLVLIGCSLNLVCGMLAPLVTGLLVGGDVEGARVLDVAPVLAVGMLLFAAAFAVVFFSKIPEPHLESTPVRFADVKDVFSFRHFAFGVLAIFLYEVIESGIPNMANLYMSNMKEVGPAVAGGVISCYWLTMTIGCAVGGLLGGRVSARVMMACCSLAGAALLVAVMFMPLEMVTVAGRTIPKSMVLMALCGFCTSIMWSSIFNLAVEGLGGRLELASGIFMTMVCGGMLLPLQGLLADGIGILNSYSLTILLFAYLFAYAVALSRPVRATDGKPSHGNQAT